MIDLKKYVGRSVLVQLRGPYQMVRAAGMTPVPMAIVEEAGGVRVATAADGANAQQLVVPTIVGTVVERSGAYVVQYKDESSDKKIEVELPAEVVFSVSSVSEERILLA